MMCGGWCRDVGRRTTATPKRGGTSKSRSRPRPRSSPQRRSWKARSLSQTGSRQRWLLGCTCSGAVFLVGPACGDVLWCGVCNFSDFKPHSEWMDRPFRVLCLSGGFLSLLRSVKMCVTVMSLFVCSYDLLCVELFSVSFILSLRCCCAVSIFEC